MRLLFIVNASASSVTDRARVVIAKALSADHRVAVASTSRRGHASRLAQGAAADGYDVVVVLGGDGTLNEAANGLAGTHTALAALPGGSTNVFARTLGVPNDPVEATGELLGALSRGAIRPVNLGSVNGRYFLFHVGLGFDAAVVSNVEKRSRLKRYAGHPLFVYAALTTWWRGYDRSHPRLKAYPGGAEPIEDGYFSLCLNTDPYTFLRDRAVHVAPGTGLDNGLTLITFRNLKFSSVIGVATAALRGGDSLPGGSAPGNTAPTQPGEKGSTATRRRVVWNRNLDEVTITANEPLPWQADGDYLGTAERFSLRSHPSALRMVVPSLKPDLT